MSKKAKDQGLPVMASPEKPRAVNLAPRLAFAEEVNRFRPPRSPATRAQTQDEELTFALWLWAMAQPFVNLHRRQVKKFAEQFDLTVVERPVSEHGMIWGEMYSQPGSIAVEYDGRDCVARVAVERVWPN